MTFGVVMKIFGKFAYLFIASLIMGTAFGLVAALLLKKMQCQHVSTGNLMPESPLQGSLVNSVALPRPTTET